MNFHQLHEQDYPLLIANVWDVPSAKIAEKLGFQAIGTSSAAIATMLGYQDGEEISFTELEYIVSRIAANTKLPLTVDLESGYSRDPLIVSDHIKRIADLGVVGINIEDSVVIDQRRLIDSEAFSTFLQDIKESLQKQNIDIFINVRTDTFLLNIANKIEETIIRMNQYEQAGANGIFIPCLEKESDIREIMKNTSLPMNIMCMPGLQNFKKLQELGVKRISMGNFLYDNMYKKLESDLKNIKKNDSFESIF